MQIFTQSLATGKTVVLQCHESGAVGSLRTQLEILQGEL